MSAAAHADIAVLGGGLAGLSLAAELSAPSGAGLGPRVVVVEPRPRYRRDRTWCFWNTFPHGFDEAIAHEWPRWSVRHRGRTVVRSAPGLRYQCIPGDRFYAAALAKTGRGSRTEVWLGERAGAVHPDPAGVRIETSRGPLVAGRALDSRPSPARSVPRGSGWLQHFAGWCVRTERDVFSPDTATLMDFDVPQPPDGVHFVYVLPFGPREALVEATTFSPAPLPPASYEASIRAFLRDRYGVERFEVAWRESGVIPMNGRARRAPRGGRLTQVGSAGGAVKPSTGYAFPFVQRFAQDFAARLRADPRARAPRPHGLLAGVLDRVFLDALSRDPASGPALFYRLFELAPPASLVRFLSESAGPVDVLRVLLAMPKRRFLAQAARTLLRSPWRLP